MKKLLFVLLMFVSLSLSAQSYYSNSVTYADSEGAASEDMFTEVEMVNDTLVIADGISIDTYTLKSKDKHLAIYVNEFSQVRVLFDNHVIYVIEEPIIGAKRSFIAVNRNQ